MSKLPNIIQRRELEPLMHRAFKFAKHYEKAADCAVSVMGSNLDSGSNQLNIVCQNCKRISAENTEKSCALLHTEAVNEARQIGGSYIYLCPEGLTFWTSPFYSGERFAGAFISGGVTAKNSGKVKALANMMLICADQVSSVNIIKNKISAQIDNSIFNQDFSETGEYEENKNIENTAVSIDMERLLLANLRRGDNIEAEKILLNLLNTRYNEVKRNLPAFRLKAMELAVFLSRAAIDPNDISDETVLEANNLYLNRIEESESLDETIKILFSFIKKISGIFFSFHGVRHF
jgi:ligand-binding sensor protein